MPFFDLVGSPFEKCYQYAEGIGSEAKYSHMISFLQLSSTHVLMVDRWNNCLRLVDRFNRQSSLFAGNCTSGPNHKDGLSPLFYYPWLAMRDLRDKEKLLVSEWGYRAIRIIDLKSVRAETLVQDDRLFEAREFTQLKGSGDLYIVMVNGVMKYSVRDRTLTQISGSLAQGSTDGALLDARFFRPNAIEFLSAEKFLLTDSYNNLLRVVDLEANTTESLCLGGQHPVNGGFEICQLHEPTSILRVNETTLYIGTRNSIRTLQGLLYQTNSHS